MSTSYYYFAASLPMLTFDGKPPLSTQDFLNECERLLNAKDFSDMKLALSQSSRSSCANNDVVRQWVEFNRRFRNEIAWFRAIEKNKDPLNYIRGDRYVEPYMVDVVVEASKAANPLLAEKILDRVRWRRLENLRKGHVFDFDYLIIYGLKLSILERYQDIASDKGKQILGGFVDMELPEFEHV